MMVALTFLNCTAMARSHRATETVALQKGSVSLTLQEGSTACLAHGSTR